MTAYYRKIFNLVLPIIMLIGITSFALTERHYCELARGMRDQALAIAEKEVAFNRDCMHSLDRAVAQKTPTLTHLRDDTLTCTCEGKPELLTQVNHTGDGGPPDDVSCRCAP